MKKLYLILTVLFAMVIVGQSQITTLYMGTGKTYIERTTDVTLTNAVAQYYKVVAPQHVYTGQVVTVTMDSLTGDHTQISLQLSGRVSDQTTVWTAIGSPIVWTMDNAWASEDTVIVYANETENYFREFKFTFTGTGTGTTTIGNFEFKQFLGVK